jgi:hypothetical protein
MTLIPIFLKSTIGIYPLIIPYFSNLLLILNTACGERFIDLAMSLSGILLESSIFLRTILSFSVSFGKLGFLWSILIALGYVINQALYFFRIFIMHRDCQKTYAAGFFMQNPGVRMPETMRKFMSGK